MTIYLGPYMIFPNIVSEVVVGETSRCPTCIGGAPYDSWHFCPNCGQRLVKSPIRKKETVTFYDVIVAIETDNPEVASDLKETFHETTHGEHIIFFDKIEDGIGVECDSDLMPFEFENLDVIDPQKSINHFREKIEPVIKWFIDNGFEFPDIKFGIITIL